jgi:hypothetical protein
LPVVSAAAGAAKQAQQASPATNRATARRPAPFLTMDRRFRQRFMIGFIDALKF